MVDPRTLLREGGLRPKGSWGQNFLVSERALSAIVEAVQAGPHDTIVEIGAGLGTLTAALAGTGARVVAIEREREVAALLKREMANASRVEVVEANALDFDYGAHPGAIVVGNLPYQLSGALLRRLFDAAHGLKRIVVMLQREVADRLVARPPGRNWGILGALTAAVGSARIVLKLPPGAFYPPPRVHSAVVRIEPAPAGLDEKLARVIHAAFQGKRKILRNALIDSGIGAPDVIDQALRASRIDPRCRAETLTIQALRRLAAGFEG